MSGFVGNPIGRLLIRQHNTFARTILKATYGDKGRLTPEIHRLFVEPLSRSEERKGCRAVATQIIAASDWSDDLWAQRNRLNDRIRLIAWG